VYAALRHTETQAILVVINVGDRPIEEYRLNLAEGPLTAVSPTLLFGSGSITPPTLNESGGFADYQPLPELLPHSTTIILLADG
jgi:hypothetical protein